MAIDLDTYVKGVLDGKRAIVARAITLVESTRPQHRALAQELLTELLPHSGRARRIGVSGVPGAIAKFCRPRIRLGWGHAQSGQGVGVSTTSPMQKLAMCATASALW
jgi:hypothetical protein